jgi:hypothetical protein
MNKRLLLARAGVGAAGALLLTSVAGAAIADVVETDEVDVNVEIAELEPVGELTMSVAADSTTLTEVETEEEDVRQFNGVLPTVTVTDDREEVPEGVFWYVNGQSSDFTADDGDSTIGADQLGWEPAIVSENDGEVAPGDEVLTSLDEPTTEDGVPPNNVGLEGQELLYLAWDSQEASVQGEWSANADLFLKTERDVEPGSYSATLTLTLWEDAYTDGEDEDQP